MNQIEIGKFLQQLRKEKGLTQEQLAERFHIARRTVSRWETGSNLPDLDLLIELSDFYAVDLRELLNGERTDKKMNKDMAEFVMKDLVRQKGLKEKYEIASAATSREEIGNPVYPPARRKLAEHGIACAGHAARQMTRQDYEHFDLILGMDHANIRNIQRIAGGDPDRKISLLLDHAGRQGQEVADPWYTDDFDAAWNDISDGCEGLLSELENAV